MRKFLGAVRGGRSGVAIEQRFSPLPALNPQGGSVYPGEELRCAIDV